MPDFHYSERDDQVFPELFKKFRVFAQSEDSNWFVKSFDSELGALIWMKCYKDDYPGITLYIE